MFPTLDEVRGLEWETLRVITETGIFARLGDLQAAAKSGLKRINRDRGAVNVHLGFTLDIRLRGDRQARLRRVDVGALVSPTPDQRSIQNASYGVTICRTNDPTTSAIVRKLHFDYEPIAFRNRGEPKPTVHMQICGQLSPHHLAAGYTQLRLKTLFPQWEKPRIPVPPVSLALLLNWLLLEFQSDVASQGALRDDRWRNIVASAERTMLIPYFDAASKFLNAATHAKSRFYQRHLYELSNEWS